MIDSKENVLAIICSKDTKENYLKYLELLSIVNDNEYCYSFINDIIELIKNEKSYIRIRSFKVVCTLSKYDKSNVINKNISFILSILSDDKPTIVRQALTALNILLNNKPSLKKNVEQSLDSMNISKYKNSMIPLIKSDIEALKKNCL